MNKTMKNWNSKVLKREVGSMFSVLAIGKPSEAEMQNLGIPLVSIWKN